MNNETTKRLALLRNEMKKINADAFYFSGTDPHHSEYLADHWKSIPYFSSFTGSAATMIVTQENAALWTDSRYFIQAEKELEGTGIELQRLRVDADTHVDWLFNHIELGGQVATDLSCLMVHEYQQFMNHWNPTDSFPMPFRFIDGTNCLNAAWKNRPTLPANPIFEHDEKYCGNSRKEKINAILNHIKKSDSLGILLSSLDEIAWTFNLRGSDINFNPVFLAYALIKPNKTVLFVQENCLSKELELKLNNDGIEIGLYTNPKQLFGDFNILDADPHATPVKLDPEIATKIEYATDTDLCQEMHILVDAMLSINYKNSVVKDMKSIKTPREIEHLRSAMVKDGVAMVKFLNWLDLNIGKTGTHHEYELVNMLTSFRAQQDGFIGNSFYPIMSYNANGAIVHRSVTAETSANIEENGILLFDSGGQYHSGTTDITRTIAIGTPSEEAKHDFTLVLKGMIALSLAKFPQGTPGCNLDILARHALWQHGLNYGHGTGHGVGYFLNVHEGPQSIRQEYNPETIKAGMVISNEPGLYRTGKYGIRIENCMVCVEEMKTEFGNFLSFETLTLCPIDKRLINVSMLSASEIEWINAYHKKCHEKLNDYLSDEEQKYLKELTSPI